MKKYGARDFRAKYVQVDPGEILNANTWYRSPLSKSDHLLGEDRDWFEDEIAWCGFALGAARDFVTGEEYGGLWVSERRSGKCATCQRKQKEWDAQLNYAQ